MVKRMQRCHIILKLLVVAEQEVWYSDHGNHFTPYSSYQHHDWASVPIDLFFLDILTHCNHKVSWIFPCNPLLRNYRGILRLEEISSQVKFTAWRPKRSKDVQNRNVCYPGWRTPVINSLPYRAGSIDLPNVCQETSRYSISEHSLSLSILVVVFGSLWVLSHHLASEYKIRGNRCKLSLIL